MPRKRALGVIPHKFSNFTTKNTFGAIVRVLEALKRVACALFALGPSKPASEKNENILYK